MKNVADRPSITFTLLAISAVVLALGFIGLLALGLVQAGKRSAGVLIQNSFGEIKISERPASDFRLALFNGGHFHLSEARGKVVLLDFWAAWCPPCRDEAPVLERVWRDYQERGVVVVGVNVFDDQGEARNFIRDLAITYPNGPDPGGLAVEYGVVGLPEKYLIDRTGRIVRKLAGPVRYETLSHFLDGLLGEADVEGAAPSR